MEPPLTESSRVARLAHFLSYALHPAVLMVATMVALSAHGRGDLWLSLLDAGILLLGLLPGLGFIAYKARRGEVSHVHLLLKEERRIILPLLLAGIAGALLVYALIGAPRFIIDGLVIGLIEGAVVTLITRFWKISLHATVGMCCAAFCLTTSAALAAAIAVIAVVTGIARLPINHHTPAQVLAGWAYGFGATAALLWALTDYL